MYIVNSYGLAVLMCMITMLCWGSWANTQKLTRIPFQSFYWDYTLGILVFSLLFAFTFGSHGLEGRNFLTDLQQASLTNLGLVFTGGIVFNLANLLLVAAIAITGMSVAFPIAIGLALVIGVGVNYVATPLGNPWVLALGVILIVVAMSLSANAYQRMKPMNRDQKGILIALISGVLMGIHFLFVASGMSLNLIQPEIYKLTPYTAMVIFAVAIGISSLVFNTWMIKKPLTGQPLQYLRYSALTLKDHGAGILGGMIWTIGTMLMFLASTQAGSAISFGLGQGATMIAALWGIFIWREFKNAPAGTNMRLTFMMLCYFFGLTLIVVARNT